MAKDIPQLQELAGKVWKKEDELKQLKCELSALDRKIQLELAPPVSVNEEQQQGQKQETDTPKYINDSRQHPQSFKGLKI